MKNLQLFLRISIAIICSVAAVTAAGAAWRWSGSYGDKAVEMLIIGDIQVQRRGFM